jgi:hypothetical protein
MLNEGQYGGGGSMDYLTEAKKFIERARDASSPEVITQDLSMAEWCLAQAIAERSGSQDGTQPKKAN